MGLWRLLRTMGSMLRRRARALLPPLLLTSALLLLVLRDRSAEGERVLSAKLLSAGSAKVRTTFGNRVDDSKGEEWDAKVRTDAGYTTSHKPSVEGEIGAFENDREHRIDINLSKGGAWAHNPMRTPDASRNEEPQWNRAASSIIAAQIANSGHAANSVRTEVPNAWKMEQLSAASEPNRLRSQSSAINGPTTVGVRENDTANTITNSTKRSYVSGERFLDFDLIDEGEADADPIPVPVLIKSETIPQQTTQKPGESPHSDRDVLANDQLKHPATLAPSTMLPPIKILESGVKGNEIVDSDQQIRRESMTKSAIGTIRNVLGHIKAKYANKPVAANEYGTTQNRKNTFEASPKTAEKRPNPAKPSTASNQPSNTVINSPSHGPSSVQTVNKHIHQTHLASTADTTVEHQLPGCSCVRRYSAAAVAALNGTRSSCGGFADLRGPGQNVISYSFYGNASSVFFRGIEANLKMVPDIYPGWIVRVYNDIDRSIPTQNQLVCDIECRYDNVDFCDVRSLPGLGDLSKKFGMIWRFMPLADETVERFIVRDLDSLIGTRERAAVDDWIASNRTFHAMRDAPAHGTEMLGGMWGGWNRYNSLYSKVRARIIKSTQWKFKGLDQRVLTVVLWPLIVKNHDLIAHDSFLCWYYPMSRPFPTKRRDIYDIVGAPNLIDSKFRLQTHCSFFCRPRGHRDWLWC